MTARAKYFYGPILAVALIGLWAELLGLVFGNRHVVALGGIFFGGGLLTVIGVGNFILDFIIDERRETK